MSAELDDMENVSISIIVPVYNVELYLSDCLDSILKQNYSDYEVVCINDASTDSSGEILREYAKQYNQIKIITHLKNRGLSAARNTGLANAKGKYILFVDSDDMIVPNTLIELNQVVTQKRVDIVYFDMDVRYRDIYKEGINITSQSFGNTEIYSGRDLFCLFVENKSMKPEVCRQFIRSGFLEEFGIRFYEGILHEDELFSFTCAMLASRVTNLSRKYYIYRQRPGSITSKRNNMRAESVFVILIQILAFWVSHTFTDRENEAISGYFASLYNTYRYYSCFEEGKSCLEVGGYAEKSLYEILQTANASRYLALSEKHLSRIKQAKHVIVFGAGKAAMDVVNVLKRNNIHIDIIAVSETDNNLNMFCGIQVDSIDNIACYIKEALVIIGVTEKNGKGIREKLEKLGYRDIIQPEQAVK